MGQYIQADYSRWPSPSFSWVVEPFWNKPHLALVFDGIDFIDPSVWDIGKGHQGGKYFHNGNYSITIMISLFITKGVGC